MCFCVNKDPRKISDALFLFHIATLKGYNLLSMEQAAQEVMHPNACTSRQIREFGDLVARSCLPNAQRNEEVKNLDIKVCII